MKNNSKATEDENFPIVAIGASAGGLAAFEEFFVAIPDGVMPQMAFVLIQHLAPEHKSILTDLISHYTNMKVFEVEDSMQVQINCVYIIPPNYEMALSKNSLQLFKPSALHGHRLLIDFFFNSLAQEKHENAIAIILSGTGKDGTMGAQAIKNENGMVIAQSPESAEYDGMPSSAIESGVVDYILGANEMFNHLFIYLFQQKSEDKLFLTLPKPQSTNQLEKIFTLLRSQTGHDFTQYKPSTMYRRIERQMAVNNIESIEDYIHFVGKKPKELESLFKSLLIGVTSFFRDKEAFQYLEDEIIPKLFVGKSLDKPLRIWVAACSTAEEVYSIAILLQEQMQRLKQDFFVQIFATDIDPDAIAIARDGIYKIDAKSNISNKRLKQFFNKEPHGNRYKINKDIRNMVVFSEHSPIKDPPFSKLDLISCRNLLIYMNVELQEKILGVFHYALKPNGYLFLGNSETVGKQDQFFSLENTQAKVYKKRDVCSDVEKISFSNIIPHNIDNTPTSKFLIKSETDMRLPLRELTEQTILKHIAPSSALINEDGDILYLHGRMGKYLEMASGLAGVNNILRMTREELQYNLMLAFKEVKKTDKTVRYYGITIKSDGELIRVNLTVHSVDASNGTTLYVVIVEEMNDEYYLTNTKIQNPTEDSKLSTDERIVVLKQKLLLQENILQDANDKLERTNNELRAYNEEIQSMNEELQSTNEELETSKEELQSVNEELSTVNTELQSKVSDLFQSNNDMNNLLAGTGIGTIFVNHQLSILRFTPAVTEIINLIASDIGRTVGDIVSNLVGYNNLIDDTQTVLNTLIPFEIEVQTKMGAWYLMHIQPYRTLKNVIEGAVISFINISEMVKIRQELQKANEISRLAIVVHDAHDAITVQNIKGEIIAWNPAAQKMYGWSEAEALKMNVQENIPKGLHSEFKTIVKNLMQGDVVKPYLTKRLCKNGEIHNVYLTATALKNSNEKVYAIATTEQIVLKNK